MARFSLLAAALLLAALASCALATVSIEENELVIDAVQVALTATFGLEAWLSSSSGMVVLPSSANADNATALCLSHFARLLRTSEPAPIFLGDAGDAAFDQENGDFYFVAGFTGEEWVLPLKHLRPRPVAVGDEGVPASITAQRKMRLAESKMRVEMAENAPRTAAIKITVDAGHGGSDPGAVAQGQTEAAITLDIAIRLRDLLVNDKGRWSVQMTRSSNVDVSLTARTNMANNWPADRFVSIHVNSFTSSSAQGTETYSYQSGTTAAKLRDRIQQEMIKAWGLTNRGSKTGNFHVLRETTMPATLSETGFITSPIDIVKLRDPAARQQAAAAHLYALRYHFGFATEE